MSVFLFAASFVVMLLASLVHQVELVHQSALLQQFQGAVNSDTIQLRVQLLGHVEQAFGVQVTTSLVDEIEQNFALPGETDTASGGPAGRYCGLAGNGG